MQLRNARLCIDCEEIHEAQQCPMCASETFAYIGKWVAAPERRMKPRPIAPSRVPSPTKVIGYGVAGLAVMGIVRWLTLGKKHFEEAALNRNIGELK
jgi:hypothetical protein